MRSLECVLNQLLKRLSVRTAITSSSCCHHWSTGIGWISFSAQMCLNTSESSFDVRPSTSILRLFLSPSDRSIGILFQLTNDFREWEWTKTLNSNNSNIISILFCSISFKIIVNLARAKNDFFNLARFKSICVFVSDKRLEFGPFSELLNGRASSLKSKKFFWCDYDERFSERKSHLGSQ